MDNYDLERRICDECHMNKVCLYKCDRLKLLTEDNDALENMFSNTNNNKST